jgi:hypothetical protein
MVIAVALIGVIGAGSIGAIITDLPATRPLTRYRSRFDHHFAKSIELTLWKDCWRRRQSAREAAPGR